MRFDLVTPALRMASFEATDVRIPGSEGDFGVLPGHQPFLSTIRPGILDVRKADGENVLYCVGQGFVDVTPEAVTVLAEEAVAKGDIDRAACELRLKEVLKHIKELEHLPQDQAQPVELDRALRERDLLQLKIKLAA